MQKICFSAKSPRHLRGRYRCLKSANTVLTISIIKLMANSKHLTHSEPGLQWCSGCDRRWKVFGFKSPSYAFPMNCWVRTNTLLVEISKTPARPLSVSQKCKHRANDIHREARGLQEASDTQWAPVAVMQRPRQAPESFLHKNTQLCISHVLLSAYKYTFGSRPLLVSQKCKHRANDIHIQAQGQQEATTTQWTPVAVMQRPRQVSES